ncbi:hypothetical protein FF38_12040 [Lucilia cuprina]|uniref:C2H2-type domain-containing protein n=1 Tax=Lucilia cuprina TaxID=7375 RepID=A0A0L0BLK3_LUCCU|nr:hypothetical protein FF38_12040 [Lucilia cuprina]
MCLLTMMATPPKLQLLFFPHYYVVIDEPSIQIVFGEIENLRQKAYVYVIFVYVILKSAMSSLMSLFFFQVGHLKESCDMCSLELQLRHRLSSHSELHLVEIRHCSTFDLHSCRDIKVV